MDYVYQAKFEADPSGGFLVTFPDVPEAITSGSDEAQAYAGAVEALGLALRGIAAQGRPLPKSRNYKNLKPVVVAPDEALKLAVVEAFRTSGISKSELARRIDRSENEARRILDPDHATGLPLMKAALTALGKAVVISVRDAA